MFNVYYTILGEEYVCNIPFFKILYLVYFNTFKILFFDLKDYYIYLIKMKNNNIK